jgi:hypothetical protein
VPGEPPAGTLLNQAQLYGSNLWGHDDLNVLRLTHGNTEIGRIDSTFITSRSRSTARGRLAPPFIVGGLN